MLMMMMMLMMTTAMMAEQFCAVLFNAASPRIAQDPRRVRVYPWQCLVPFLNISNSGNNNNNNNNNTSSSNNNVSANSNNSNSSSGINSVGGPVQGSQPSLQHHQPALPPATAIAVAVAAVTPPPSSLAPPPTEHLVAVAGVAPPTSALHHSQHQMTPAPAVVPPPESQKDKPVTPVEPIVKADEDVDEGDDDVFEEVTESPKKTQTKRRSQSLSALKDEKQPRKVRRLSAWLRWIKLR
ncbi:hypothetical protein ElyMa_002107000 [Elysia marginata]|uniref:Uncharacterized protein n=1 Tax=Elysia marginata TaxID=1093978 RepID=A0AAV4FI74_9GAST|nr:hypothetical protein ElyMa_002107000 [Elysia marginata]